MATELVDRCSESVPLDFQEAGYELADRGDLELFRAGSAGRFLALVFAGEPDLNEEPLLVVIRWLQQKRGALNVSCTCGKIRAWQGCPHVWATLVAMTRRGYSADIPGGSPLQLACSAVAKDEKAELLVKLAGLSRDPRARQLLEAKEKPAPAAAPPWQNFRWPLGAGLAGVGPPLRGLGPDMPAPPPKTKEPAARPGASRFTFFQQRQEDALKPREPGPRRPMVAPIDRLLRSPLAPSVLPPPPPPPPPPAPDWRTQLAMVIPHRAQRDPKRPRRIYYFLGPFDSLLRTYSLEFWQQELLATGKWGVLKTAWLQANELADLPPAERQLVKRLFEAHREIWMEPPREPLRARMVALPSSILPLLLPSFAATGRFGRRLAEGKGGEGKKYDLLEWDAGGPWRLAIEGGSAEGEGLALRARLRREGEELPFSQLEEILPGGLFRRGNRLAELEPGTAEEWLRSLRHAPEIVVPEAEVAEALTRLAEVPASPAVELDDAWQRKIAAEKPLPGLRLDLEPGGAFLPVRLLFVYGGVEVSPGDPRQLVFSSAENKLFRRARELEKQLAERLPAVIDEAFEGLLPAEDSAALLEELAAEGWLIGAGDKKLRSGGRFKARVESGVDWFDLGGSLDFGDQEVPLPSLLEAVRQGRGWVNLADGSVGLLPAGWVRRWSALVELSRSKEDLRFGRGQALVLHNILKGEAEVETDAIFGRIRERLRSFDKLEPAVEPAGFLGELRPYQRLGLAWLELLSELGLGGCLADDMGLGKTVQVLAWLLRRKRAGLGGGKPHLLVVPRSLVFNWAAELRRFTPEIAFAVSHGAGRESVLDDLYGKDLLITTYGTLVRDIDKLRTVAFDVLVVDEAQAIKNRATQAAEACAAVPAGLRLALTGTPVENHLGELWSIFEFLNPGLLGSLPKVAKYAGRQRLPPSALAEVAAALRPLILRRKKSEVLRELPAKTEQTIVCQLGGAEKKRYEELRLYYQASLNKKISEVGLGRAKIWVLEALLRLRQAACHPGLLDKKARGEPSAKLETLLGSLEQVLAEGHKAIVFSQFTSLLAILREQLDARGQTYEYLDGKTRDREARVRRFQDDPELKLFLISLKAGGVGLNLTAASYVFLLDPWWNPAVESQAIDRAHRIGQAQPVFAYRIIAEGTVEEKILKLQEEKRALADAIVAEDARVLKQLTAADLEQLLG
jgi:superfamily II DNA or RNA helicase